MLLWQMWQFIAAGLYQKERKIVHSYFPTSVVLFFVFEPLKRLGRISINRLEAGSNDFRAGFLTVP